MSVDIKAITKAIQALASPDPIDQERAVAQLVDLSLNGDNREEIAKARGIRPMVFLLKPTTNQALLMKLMRALRNLSHTDEVRLEIARSGALDSLQQLLKSPSHHIQAKAAATLNILSISAENRIEISSSKHDIIPTLIEMLKSTSQHVQARAATALWTIAGTPENRVEISRKGGVRPLIDLLGSPNETVQAQASGALSNVAGNADNQVEIAKKGGIKPLVDLLSSPNQEVQTQAAAALSNIALNSENRVEIQVAGGIVPLINLLKSSNTEVLGKATGAIWNLAGNPSNTLEIVKAGGIPILIDLLSIDQLEVVTRAAGALSNIAGTTEFRAEIAKRKGIPPLVALSRHESEQVQVTAVTALWNLSANPDNRQEIARVGGIESLIELLKSPNQDIQGKAAGALSNIGGNDTLRVDIARAGGIRPLVELLKSESAVAQAQAATALWALSRNPDNRQEIVKHKGVPLLLELLKSTAPNVQTKAAGALWNISRTIQFTPQIAPCAKCLVHNVTSNTNYGHAIFFQCALLCDVIVYGLVPAPPGANECIAKGIKLLEDQKTYLLQYSWDSKEDFDHITDILKNTAIVEILQFHLTIAQCLSADDRYLKVMKEQPFVNTILRVRESTTNKKVRVAADLLLTVLISNSIDLDNGPQPLLINEGSSRSTSLSRLGFGSMNNTSMLQSSNSAASVGFSDVLSWTKEEVADWIANTVKLPQYKDIFLDNAISGAHLTKLTESNLREDFGIKPLGHRMDIITSLRKILPKDAMVPQE
eukprot:TRINITY_DN16313_c0_g1_i1.p1 TRINITY_DN16313_c0_g1~~TRINITY_DN16313_c0_g1_i1.p1  ORF type:complete len:767 (-),score=188.41 TRINITY_DN16313_c0_g1_i1:41-2341(-)